MALLGDLTPRFFKTVATSVGWLSPVFVIAVVCEERFLTVKQSFKVLQNEEKVFMRVFIVDDSSVFVLCVFSWLALICNLIPK